MNMQATLDISNERIQNAYRVLNAVGEKANSSGKSQLIEGDRYIDLYIHYDLEGDKKNTPVVVELKHSLFNAEDGDNAILIIGKNDTTTKDYLEEHPVPGVEKVTSMDKIRTTIATHQQKRDLLRLYKRFLCDAAILPMMPSILGNKCFKWNKQPFPVALKGTIEDNVKSALSSTQMLVNCGPIMSIRVGLESFTEDQIVENLNCVLPVLFKYIKPSNILSISLRVLSFYFCSCLEG